MRRLLVIWLLVELVNEENWKMFPLALGRFMKSVGGKPNEGILKSKEDDVGLKSKVDAGGTNA